MKSIAKLVAGAVALIGAPAMALTLMPTSATYALGGSGGGIHVGNLAAYGANGYNEYGPSGLIDFRGTIVGGGAAFSALTYCFDVTTGVFTNDPLHLFEQRTVTAFSTNAVKQQQIAGLLTGSAALMNAATTTAQKDSIAVATGLAVWELTYETGTSGYSVTGVSPLVGTGNFYNYGDFIPAEATANVYLANVMSGAWTGDASRVVTLISLDGSSQNQVFLAAAVPEPATWGLMIVGFGAVGMTLRRRRVMSTAAIA